MPIEREGGNKNTAKRAKHPYDFREIKGGCEKHPKKE